MSTAGGSNEKLLKYDDVARVVKQGDLILSADVEGRAYLVLDKRRGPASSIPSCQGDLILTLLSPEGEILRAQPGYYKYHFLRNVWMVRDDFHSKIRSLFDDLKFYVLPRAQ